MHARTRSRMHVDFLGKRRSKLPNGIRINNTTLACVRACVLTRAHICAWVKCEPVRVQDYVRPSVVVMEIGKLFPGVFLGKHGTPGLGLRVVMVSSCNDTLKHPGCQWFHSMVMCHTFC